MGSIGGIHCLNLPNRKCFKEYSHREVKSTTKQELIDGISQFCLALDEHKFQHYIGHLRKVIPKVIEVNGNATRYYRRT